MTQKVKGVFLAIGAAAVLALAHIPAFRVNGTAMIVAWGVLSALLYAQCRLGPALMPYIQAVGLALMAWLMDIADGPTSVVYGAAWVAMALCFARIPSDQRIKAAFAAAFAYYAVGVLGSSLVLTFGRARMSFYGALGFALRQQAFSAAACLAGGLAAGLLFKRYPPAA